MIHDTKPPLDEALLIHYGKKGMKWGVINEDKPLGRDKGKSPEKKSKENASTKEYMALIQKRKDPSPQQQKRNMAESHAKFAAKFKSEEPDAKKGLSSAQKKALIGVGVGAVVIGGALAYKYYGGKKMPAGIDPFAEIRDMVGQKVDSGKYYEAVDNTRVHAWGGGYIQPSSFLKGDQTFPAGHTFHRLSQDAETMFMKKTYATDGIDDFNRYLTVFKDELGGNAAALHHVTFKTKEPLNIPSLNNALEVLRGVINPDSDTPASREAAVEAYQKLSGSYWESDLAVRFKGALANKGYHGLVDEMDAGVVGQNPLVLFASDILTPPKSTPLTQEFVNEALNNITEINNRKYP